MNGINKALLMVVSGLVGMAIFNRSRTGQELIVAAEVAAENLAEGAGLVDKMTQAQKNERAFLRMIRLAEGTAGVDGYRMLFGGGLFASYADHPRVVVKKTSNGQPISSSAAGAYQILRGTWDALKPRLGLKDFSPESQDRAALELIREKGALVDVQLGYFDVAVGKVRKVWASLPGAGYGQPERKLADLKKAFIDAGGVVA